ncbi:MAG: hypothetical protein HC918_00895 [Oscillatoriales cyanobacterium SM2_1_8]|nr:hypothetical protein [Oscillatoriales cyanobacterium SM2_1_8]
MGWPSCCACWRRWGGGTIAADRPGIQVVALTAPTAPAAIAGLQPGDVIQSANGQTFSGDVGVLTQFQRLVAEGGDRPLLLTVDRQGPSAKSPSKLPWCRWASPTTPASALPSTMWARCDADRPRIFWWP